jgi:hypothetical protein
MPAAFLDRWSTKHAGPVRNIVVKPRSSTNEGALPDPEMTRRTDTRHDNRPTPNDCAAGQAGLRHDQRFFPDITVVGDLNLIVDLGTPPNTRLVQGRAIHRRIRPDLDIVLDHDTTSLGHRHRSPLGVGNVSKPIAPENHARLQYDPIPHPGILPEDRSGIDPTIPTNLDVRDQNRPRGHNRIRTDSTARTNPSPGLDTSTGIDQRCHVDQRASFDPDTWPIRRSELLN